MTKNPDFLKRFTFFEIIQILVILALVIIAIISGQKVTQQARDKRIWADIEKYLAAYATFELMHNSAPGDIEDAFMIWGHLPNIGCVDESVTFNPKGCNGNGDSQIDAYTEEFRAWQHLALSNLIDYSFSGEKGETKPFHPGHNVPEGAYLGSIYRLFFFDKSNGIMFESDDSKQGFPSEIILNFEEKLDDGSPLSGKIIGIDDDNTSCLVKSDDNTEYNRSDAKKNKCKIFFPIP